MCSTPPRAPACPSYDGGGKAPHFTVVPNTKTRTVTIYQHFDTNRPSRALVSKLSGGTQTNNDGCIQIELSGTCDPIARQEARPVLLA